VSARIHPLTDCSAGRVHAYLLEDDDGLTLIDTLSGTGGAVVADALAHLGRALRDLRRIVLTHAHRSHVRGAARLRELSGATVHAHRFEAATITGERPCAPTGLWPRRPYRVYHLQAGLTIGSHVERLTGRRLDAFTAPPCPVDVDLADGAAVGSLQAIHTPGHTDGSMSFYWPAERALFTGDVLVTWPRLEAGWRGLTTDMERNRRSLSELGTVGDVEWIGTGHGPPLVHDAAARVRALLAGMPRR
jgi:glyoxylase-like metal-dependent hydrolase (beta-lactamase superfamily II)